MLQMQDKVVVVTGAGTGIGRGLARKAAACGARVAVLDIILDDATKTAALIESEGGVARAYHADITELAMLRGVAEQVEEHYGRINIVFNNAGVFTFGALTDTNPEDFAWVFDVNVRGLYNAAVAFVPALERASAAGDVAWIINTGSENSIALPIMGPCTAYTATKHAVLGLSDGLRRDLTGKGIGVSVFCPGLVQTDLWNSKRARQERFGGPIEMPPETAKAMAAGRSVEATVETVFAGLDAGEFLIVTDTNIREFTRGRLDEIERALDTADARITGA